MAEEEVRQGAVGDARGRTGRVVEWLERASYVAVGLLIVGAIAHNLIVVLIMAGLALLQGREPPFFSLLDRVLFVLMLVEILHTVRVSLGPRRVVIETFLVVGVIASVRRILVITLGEGAIHGAPGVINWAVLGEIGMLAVMILVLVVGVYLLRQAPDSLK